MANKIEQIAQENERLVVLFTRGDCPYCIYLDPLFDQLMQAYGEQVTFLKVDINEQADLLKEKHTYEYVPTATFLKERYDFTTVPTVVYFKDGQSVLQHGSDNKSITLQDLKNNMQEIYNLD
jgi:predicted bacteriocin transport accessory protein